MKGFLLDENLPARLRFSPSLPVVSVAELGPSPSDYAVWDFATLRSGCLLNRHNAHKESNLHNRHNGQTEATESGRNAVEPKFGS